MHFTLGVTWISTFEGVKAGMGTQLATAQDIEIGPGTSALLEHAQSGWMVLMEGLGLSVPSPRVPTVASEDAKPDSEEPGAETETGARDVALLSASLAKLQSKAEPAGSPAQSDLSSAAAAVDPSSLLVKNEPRPTSGRLKLALVELQPLHLPKGLNLTNSGLPAEATKAFVNPKNSARHSDQNAPKKDLRIAETGKLALNNPIQLGSQALPLPQSPMPTLEMPVAATAKTAETTPSQFEVNPRTAVRVNPAVSSAARAGNAHLNATLEATAPLVELLSSAGEDGSFTAAQLDQSPPEVAKTGVSLPSLAGSSKDDIGTFGTVSAGTARKEAASPSSSIQSGSMPLRGDAAAYPPLAPGDGKGQPEVAPAALAASSAIPAESPQNGHARANRATEQALVKTVVETPKNLVSAIPPMMAATPVTPAAGRAETDASNVPATVKEETSIDHNALTALDGYSNAPSASWILAGQHRAEAGFQDPVLGWVGIRAEADPSGVHAAVIPVSQDAALSLGTHLEGLHAYLAGQDARVDSVRLLVPEQSNAAMSAGMQGGMEQQSHGGDTRQQRNPNECQGTLWPDSSHAVRAVSMTGSDPSSAALLAARLASSGQYVSVLA
jgi:hypothetical protein